MNPISSFIAGNSSLNSSRRAPRSTPDSIHQPAIKSLPENRLDPRIEIHSIDYDFPIRIKSAQSGKPGSDTAISTAIPLSTNRAAYKNTFATEPSYVASTPLKTADSDKVGISKEEIISGPEETSGMTLTSFIESIEYREQLSLSLHIEAGFNGHQLLNDCSVAASAIEYAVMRKNIEAIELLLPVTDRAVLDDVMNEHEAFFRLHPQIKLDQASTS